MAVWSMSRLEICVDSVQSALAAEAGGATRVELCANLLEGGITPSAGMISLVRREASISLHVLIRPRGGDFCYCELEQEVMRRDIQIAKQLGVDGVVLGLLKPDGSVDLDGTRRLLEFARPLKVTFHRAFDLALNPYQALRDIISLGADYLLTSGQQPSAYAGKELIAQLVRQADGQIVIMPGGGVNEANIQELARVTGAKEFHSSARSQFPSRMQFQRKDLFMGAWQNGEHAYSIVDQSRVGKMLQALH